MIIILMCWVLPVALSKFPIQQFKSRCCAGFIMENDINNLDTSKLYLIVKFAIYNYLNHNSNFLLYIYCQNLCFDNNLLPFWPTSTWGMITCYNTNVKYPRLSILYWTSGTNYIIKKKGGGRVKYPHLWHFFDLKKITYCNCPYFFDQDLTRT